VIASTQDQYDLWRDGGTGRAILHAVTGALVAGLGGGNALQGALGAGAAELGRDLTADESRLVQQLVSLGIGALAGGGSGAATALAGERFNRQLHPREIDWINSNAAAFAAQEYGCAQACKPEQVNAARQRLTVQAARQVDARWNEILGQGGLVAQDGTAQAFLSAQTIVSGRDGFTYFAADWEQYNDHSLFADRLRGTPALDQLYGAVLGTGRNETDRRALLQALNRTDPGWTDDFVSGVLNRDAWTAFTMFTGDVGFAADIGHRMLTGDGEGAAEDLMTAILTARAGAALGGLIGRLRKPAGEVGGGNPPPNPDELPDPPKPPKPEDGNGDVPRDTSINLQEPNPPQLTIKDHYEHHLNMVLDIKDQLTAQGYRVSNKEISFGSSCGVGRCRPDIVAEAPDGTIRIIEIKTGDADLSIRQSEIFPQIKDGNAIPLGRVARAFGLIPGKPLKEQGYPNGIPIEIINFPGAK
jgi:hypothetical protein